MFSCRSLEILWGIKQSKNKCFELKHRRDGIPETEVSSQVTTGEL